MSSGSAGAKGGAEIQSKGKAETRVGAAAGNDRGQAQSAQPGKDRMSGQAKPERSTTGQGQGSSEKGELKAKGSDKNELKSKSSENGQLKSKGSAKTGEKSTTGQGAGEKNSMTQKDQGSAKKRETTGQGSSESKSQSSESKPQMNQPAQKQDQNAGKQNQTTGSTPQNQNATQTKNQGATQQSGASIQSQAGTQISAQQQTSIQQSVLSARNVPRVNSVNFAVRTGAIVPRSVRFASVTTFPVLVEFFPQYRDYSFFVVEDEVVIVDRSHKI